jgi:DHA1 family multidrug resistance protein-like MFS transporter
MKRAVKIVLILNFFQGIIHNVGHPVTPLFVTNLGIPDYMFGLFFAVMSLGLVIGSPIWGALGDLGGKAKFMFIGLLMYSIGQFGFGFVGNMWWMSFFRLLSGLGVSASITLMVSQIIEHSSAKNRSKHLAWHAALFLAGSSIGYYIGGFLSENLFFVTTFSTDEPQYIFLIQALINLGHATVMFFVIRLDEISHQTKRRKSAIEHITEVKSMDPILILFLVSLTLISLGAINVSKFIDVYMNFLSFSPYQIGVFVLVTGIVSLFANLFITPLIAKLHIDLTFMIWIQLLSALIVFIVFRLPSFMIALYSLFMFYVVLKAIYTPLEQHFIASFAKEGSYGKIMGVRQSFFSIGMVIGPLIGGVVYNYKKLWVFDLSAIMFFIGFIMLVIVGREMKKRHIINGT